MDIWGYLAVVWTGCAAQASKPLPTLRVILAEKVPIFRDFSQNIDNFFHNFGVSHGKSQKQFGNFGKMEPHLGIFFVENAQENGTHAYRFLVKK